jgi:hypothetical protein
VAVGRGDVRDVRVAVQAQEGGLVGVDVALVEVSGLGASPRRRKIRPLAAVPDSDDILACSFSEAKSPMLRRIDPYKDLILTSSEMVELIIELDLLLAFSTLEASGRIRQVMELASWCRDAPRTELHFQGD